MRQPTPASTDAATDDFDMGSTEKRCKNFITKEKNQGIVQREPRAENGQLAFPMIARQRTPADRKYIIPPTIQTHHHPTLNGSQLDITRMYTYLTSRTRQQGAAPSPPPPLPRTPTL